LKITLRTKFIVYTIVLVMVIMVNVTYFFTLREINARRDAARSEFQRVAESIATMQLLDRQDWNTYQNYITQLMSFNPDIVYVAIYDDRNTLRAHQLNTNLVDVGDRVLSRRRRAEIVRQLDSGAIAAESQGDLQTARVNIQMGERILGSVHVGFSLIEINEKLWRGIRLNIILGLVFIILFSFISVWISGRLTRPLERLNRALTAVNEGDLEQRIEPETRDEIARLTESFNEMMEGLRERKVIDHLGQGLASTFQLEQLAPLVRDRLTGALGAAGARLYIRDRKQDDKFYEITMIDEQKTKFPPLSLKQADKDYLKTHSNGFMIDTAPGEIQDALNYQPSDENGLVVPMTVKDDLFGLLFFALPASMQEYSPKQRRFAATLANQAAIALENALLYEDLREQERIQRELEIAREVQQKLLPDRMPQIDGFQIDGICQSAQEVGGDYFDFFPLADGRLGVVIADVCGKGTSASFYMAEIKGMMLQLTSLIYSPKKLLVRLNEKLYETLDRHIFVTMIYGVLDIPDRKFTFARAGHNSLLRIGVNGNTRFFTPSGIGLGLDRGLLFEKQLEEIQMPLNRNDALLLYTDGVSEAMNRQKEEFGEDRLLQVAGQGLHRSALEIRRHIETALEEFRDEMPLSDDLTLVILKCLT